MQHCQARALNTTFTPQSPSSPRSQRMDDAYSSPKSGMLRNRSTCNLPIAFAVLMPAYRQSYREALTSLALRRAERTRKL